MALNKKKTDKIQDLSGSLMSDIRRRERSSSKSDFKDRTVKMVEKRIKMHNLYIFFHHVHTYFIDTGWGGGGGGVSAQILRERTTVVSGAIERFSALFQEQTTGLFESD
jgi:hypothetical protein